MSHRLIASGTYAKPAGARRQITYAGSERAYHTLWDSIVGTGQPPAIDFEKEGALFIVAGERPTGGYAIEVRSVAADKDVLVVDAPVTGPPPDAMVTQAITTPYAVVAIPKVEAARVHWKNASDVNDQPRDR